MELIKKSLVFLLYSFCILSKGQVAVNSLESSSAAVLHLESQKYNTTEFGGFMLPVVTETQQASIPVSTVDDRDDGLMVFVNDPVTGKRCWDIYDAVSQVWRSITCTSNTCAGTTVLYQEDFSSYASNTGITGASNSNGDYPSSVTKWTLTSYSLARNGVPNYPGSLANANDYALVIGERLELQDTNGPLAFETSAIDISGYSAIEISMDISENGSLEYEAADHTDDFNCGEESVGNDYVDIEYSTNGGATFTEVGNYSGLGTSNHTLHDNLSSTVNFTISGISGTSLVIRVRFQNWANAEYYYLDNILVTCN